MTPTEQSAANADARRTVGADQTGAVWRQLRGPLRWTRLGMVAERLCAAFWPVSTVTLAGLALLAFGVQDLVPVPVAWGGIVLASVALVATATLGLRRFRMPRRADALDRLDRTLAGRPISAMADSQALGRGDGAAVLVWQAHVARMARRAAGARAPAPDLRLARRDPYALRYVALTAFVVAVMFGSLWRAATLSDLAPGAGSASAATGPTWEGWLQPPAHSGKPSLYLNDVSAPGLTVPQGSRVTLRLYGEVGALRVAETVSGAPLAVTAGQDGVDPAAAPAQEFEIVRSGTIAVEGQGGRGWEVIVTPDLPPTIRVAGPIGREADGQMSQPFTASDDYGVVSGRAEITLDLAAVDRRFGMTAEPEPREALVLDLPMPISGDRATFTETLAENMSEHPWANLPVRLTLIAADAVGQEGRSGGTALVLPGRRFFDPLAAGLIEMRRDILWSRDNGARTAQILRALTHQPEGFIRNESAYLLLRVAMRRLDAGNAAGLTPEVRDEVAAALWEVAVMVEEGDLADALARLRRAQDRLSEAIRNGANDQEIASLMQELNEAMQDYMRQLAEQNQQQDQQTAENQQGMEITGDQIQQMLDELQKLMEEGRMAEAAELLERLREMMENMQVTQGPGGEGQQGEGQQALNDLADTLREQQGLSDEAFDDLQEQFNEGQPGQGQPGQGQPGQGQQGQGQPGQGQQGQGQPGQGQPGQGQPGQGQPGQGQPGQGQSLADRQQSLRDELQRQQQGLPGAGTAEGDAARDALGRAGRAMDGAEQALRDGDVPGAIDRQAEAMDALRDGMRSLGEALAQNQQPGQPGQPGEGGGEGQQFGQAGPQGERDPLGRSTGQQGRLRSEENMLQGDDIYRHARDLLDELRRRSADQTRPEGELDYLRRLLERF